MRVKTISNSVIVNAEVSVATRVEKRGDWKIEGEAFLPSFHLSVIRNIVLVGSGGFINPIGDVRVEFSATYLPILTH